MKKVLIFFGGWEGHEPAACARFLGDKLGGRGFAVESSDSLGCLDDGAALGRFDLIMPLWTMGSLTADQERNLVGAVRAGTGLGGFHGGMGDAFRSALEYQWMVGGQFVAHPDNIKEYTVKLALPEDPIVAGLGDFGVRSEQYYMLVDPANQVLATTVFKSSTAPWIDGVVVPVAWKKRHGLGRVFYSALGHQAHEFIDVPQQLEMTLRGLVWAAR